MRRQSHAPPPMPEHLLSHVLSRLRADASDRIRCRCRGSLEIFVDLASFTGCLVAVDKLYLFYATVFYKGMAMWKPDEWEPTLRYPKRWRRGAKTPKVCVQLPMFNETFVARRVIDYACRMDYPRDKLYVQCLDDSTDPATRDVVDEGVKYWREQGVHIEAIRRTNRQGYKAGAMHEVHDAIPSEFIAIFDADFLPERDFLMRAIPVFQDKSVGFVQGRWTYLNPDESLFCRYQARARARGGGGAASAVCPCVWRRRGWALRDQPAARTHSCAPRRETSARLASHPALPACAGDLPERAHQVRAVRALLDGKFSQLQRHRRRVAQGVHRLGGWVECAHARRGHGPLAASLPKGVALCVAVRHRLP